MFAVVRHPDIAQLGIIPAAAVEGQRGRGWVRVSEYRELPSDFHLDDFAEAFDDLDAPPQPDVPAAPEEDEEQ